MKKTFLKLLVAILISVLNVIFINQTSYGILKHTDLNQMLKKGQYKQKVDTFFIILDASNSMSETQRGKVKLQIAKETISRMNQTIPDLKMESGLRTFGRNIFPFTRKTTLIYGLTKYSRGGLGEALMTVKWANGRSPMALAVDAATGDLKPAQGNMAVIIVSDGKEMDDAPILAAGRMKRAFGNRLCIYTVLVGDNIGGKGVMEKIAGAAQCGFSVNAEDIASSKDMADFVVKVFLEKGMDSDGDGVLDDMDRCPDTPGGVKVDRRGCPLDTDGDGVFDYLDKCPDTPEGLNVDPDGCPFDTDGDGVYDYLDECPNTQKGVKVDKKGCPYDRDGDGVIDELDRCPDTPGGVKVDRRGCPLDTDGDGVYDYLDRCPDTPKGVKVDRNGCPLDTDRDGVYDYLDKCPGTPRGAKVNDRGCWVLERVQFDTAKWSIKAETYPALDEVVAVLKRNPDLKVEIEGHTDIAGSKALNQKLSENRAKVVREYLTKEGINPERLSSAGYGFSRPIASNSTIAGRAKNRRVELTPKP